MTPEALMEAFDVMAEAPNGVQKLRELILQLAVRGKLVAQDPDDEPAAALMERISTTRSRMQVEGGAEKPKSLPPLNDDDIPYPVPASWQWVRLGAIAAQRLGKMLDKSKNRGALHPYLRNTNVQWLRFDLTDVKEMRFRPDEFEEYDLREGDLLVCEGGEPGRGAVWSGQHGPMKFQKALHRIRPYCDVSPWYILYSLQASAQSGSLEAYFTGATIKHLTGQSLESFALPLPPLAEQRRIVAKVGELMMLCDSLDERLERARDRASHLADSVIRHVGAA